MDAWCFKSPAEPACKHYLQFSMKRILVVFFLSLTMFLSSQTFSLIDTAVSKGQVHTSWTMNCDLAGETILEDCVATYDSIRKFLRRNPKAKIEIGVHINTGDDANKNLILSESRAQQLQEYFGYEFDTSRVLTKGYGSSKPFFTKTRKLKQIDQDKRTKDPWPVIGNTRVTIIILAPA